MTGRGKTAQAPAKAFFDRTSTSYGAKYGSASTFHHYFFRTRLEAALKDLALPGGAVLDIGSGTGALYEAMHPRWPYLRFFATDISAAMLAENPAPKEQQYLGHAYDHPFPVRQFDAIFMLGVTTYMNAEELEKNLAFVAKSLKPGGAAIITFTNAHALDTLVRDLLRRPLRWWRPGAGVLTSGVRIRSYSWSQVRSLLSARFSMVELRLLNHTVFPLSRLLPGPSVALARWLGRHNGTPRWLRWLSSDLMVVVRSAEHHA
jgi:SAM-dependent methyltransferase